MVESNPFYTGVEEVRRATQEARANDRAVAEVRRQIADVQRRVSRLQRNYQAVADRKDAAWAKVLTAATLLLQLQALDRELDNVPPVVRATSLAYKTAKLLIPELAATAHGILLKDATARQVAGAYSYSAYDMAGVVLKHAGKLPKTAKRTGSAPAERATGSTHERSGIFNDALSNAARKPASEPKKTVTGPLTIRAVTVKGGDGKPRVQATASSTAIDLEGDTFDLKALKQMRDWFGAGGRLIFLNHSYKVPHDVFGTTEKAALVKRGGRTDLDLVIAVETKNPLAVQTLDYIRGGTALGVSVGVLVNEAEKEGKGVRILDCTPCEASVVGIPANQTAWTQGAS